MPEHLNSMLNFFEKYTQIAPLHSFNTNYTTQGGGRVALFPHCLTEATRARRLGGGRSALCSPGQLGAPSQRDAKQFDPAAPICSGVDSDRALGLIHRQLYKIPE